MVVGHPRRDWRAAFAGACLLALAFAGAFGEGGRTPSAEAGTGGLKLHRIGNFSSPVYVDNAPGKPKLLFVVEQPGTVAVVRKGKTLKRPFVNLKKIVRFGGEQGLLSIAFDPAYKRTRRFFVYYVNNDGDLRVDSLRRKRKDATRADPRSRRKLIEIAHPRNDNHNGGQLAFGPDGFLYMATGDGGSAGDPEGNAQDRSSLLGKLLRIEPKRKSGYSVPGSNPFVGGAGRDEIYSLGLRNPYRFSFDAATGDLWIGDVGQDRWEEIDRVGLEGGRGANFGWDRFEGNHVFEGDGSEPPNYKPPVHEYSSAGGGNCAVTGGYVVRDPHVPGLAGRYLYADFCGGTIRSLNAGAQNPGATDSATGLELTSPSSFGEGARNRVYVASLEGGVFRIGR